MIQNINLGAAPNDKTGDKARVAGGKINANFAYLEGKIDNVDKIVSETGFSLVDLVFTINAFWEWNLNGIGYTNPEAVSINIPLCASGKKRIDYIVPNSSNTFTIISGIETTGIPAAPSIPNKDMYVSFFTITDILIESPALTIIGENYISKLEKIRLDNVNGIGSYEDWTVGDSRSCFNFSNAVTEFKSFHYHPIVFAYDGKIFTLKNSQATDITLFHNAGTGLFKFRFPNAENFVLHPNEVIEFRLNYEDTSVPKLEFIGTINSISTVEISNVTGLPEALDLKLDASAYNQHFKGVYVTLAALIAAHPTGVAGDSAQVNEVGATDVINYSWDAEENIWVAGGGTGGAANTDALPEGSTNLYWTVARFLANLTYANVIAALGFTPSTAPNDAQKNSDITKSEIEAKLTGEITTHTHPAVGGGGDMVLASVQTNTGLKTFLNGTIGFRNVANTFTSLFSNSATAARTYTFQDKSYTVADNADLTAKQTGFTGVINYLPKSATTTTLTPSRLIDTGSSFGIGTVNAPTKDITLGNQANRVIGIEDSDNIYDGRDLEIHSGRAINFVSNSNFNLVHSGSYEGRGVVCLPNGDVFSMNSNPSFLYKQIGGVGAFVSTGISSRNFKTGCATATNDLYLADYGGDIYKMTGGTGSLVALGQTSRYWRGMIAVGTDIYATVFGGGLYKQTGGVGDFVAVSGITARNWTYLAASNTGDIYGCTDGPIYKRVGGTGDFVLHSSVTAMSIVITANNDLYTGSYSSGGYKQTGLTGVFVASGVAAQCWGLSALPNLNVYAALTDGIYMQTNFAEGSPNLNGGTLRLIASGGKGAGTSRLEFYTGQKTGVSTNMQAKILREYIDENGYHIYASIPSYANDAAADADANLPSGASYKLTGNRTIFHKP